MIDPIERYLLEHTSQGHKESSGVFTISAEKALAKMASYQLPRSSSWILKMVQAGVSAGARQMAISQTAKSSRITYHGGQLGTLKEVVSLCTDSQALVTPCQQHLLTGLRSVALAQKRPVLMLEEPAEGPPSHALWNRAHLSGAQPAKPGTQLFSESSAESCLTFHVGALAPGELPKKTARRGIQGVIADEFRDLVSHGVACPVPLFLDGRRLDHFGLDDVSFNRSPLLFGADACQEGEAGFAISPSVALVEGEDPVLYRAAWTVYLTDQSRPGEICWIKDGVVCQSDKIPAMKSPFLLRLFLCAQDFETDLTGLQLRFPEGVRRTMIRQALKAFADSAPTITSSKPLPFRANHAPRSGAWWGGAVLTASGVILAPLTMGAGLLLSLTGLLGMGSSSRDEQRRYEEEMKSQLPRWAEVMARTSPS